MGYMFLPFRRYFDFSGRSRRLEFWLFALLNLIVSFVFGAVFFALFAGQLFDLFQRYGRSVYDSYQTYGQSSFGVGWNFKVPPDVLLAEIGPVGTVMLALLCIYSLIVFIPGLAVAVRRLHDGNRSGWWIALPMLPYLLAGLCFVIAYTTPGATWVALALGTALGGISGLLGLVLIVLLLLEGTRGSNRFGPDPKPYMPPPPRW